MRLSFFRDVLLWNRTTQSCRFWKKNTRRIHRTKILFSLFLIAFRANPLQHKAGSDTHFAKINWIRCLLLVARKCSLSRFSSDPRMNNPSSMFSLLFACARHTNSLQNAKTFLVCQIRCRSSARLAFDCRFIYSRLQLCIAVDIPRNDDLSWILTTARR